jgi:hypothetical protein
MRAEKIFIVGCPRTGKTLLSQILNKSSEICIAEETQYLRKLSHIGRHRNLSRFGDLSDDDNVYRLASWMYSQLKAPYWIWLRSQVTLEEYTDRILQIERNDKSIFIFLMQFYAERTRGGDVDQLILGEETPTHIYYIPTLLDWFPAAKILHLFRDPRAIIVSQLEQVRMYGGITSKINSLPKRLFDPLTAPLEVFYLTKLWKDAIRLHHRYQRMYSENYLFVVFEDLINNPNQWIPKISQFLNIYADDVMQSEAELVKSIIDNGEQSWRESIDPWANTWFSLLLRKQLKDFGYM